MFTRKRAHTATNATPTPTRAPPPPPPPPPPPLPEPPNDANTVAAVPVSPLQMTFDFELPTAGSDFLPSPFSSSTGHSDDLFSSMGLSAGASAIAKSSPRAGPQTPASNVSNVSSMDNSKRAVQVDGAEDAHVLRSDSGRRARDDSDNASASSTKAAVDARLSFEHPAPSDITSLPPSTTPADTQDALQLRPQTAGGTSSANSTPIMEASLFPVRTDTLAPHTDTQGPIAPTTPAMSRSFIDSRDKPYSQSPRPFLHHTHSSPNLLRPPTAHGPIPIPNSRISPQPSMQNLSPRTNYSGSTARPSTQASSRTAFSAVPTVTIGTPYQATADSFPLPQLVATRPKTPGASAVVKGVKVPTHHTSSLKPDKKEQPKKRGRLLNPIALLQRRRSAQDPEGIVEERATRQAQAQALARQRDVLTSGVNKPPPDFDPRIKGNVVHDFSAPREKRNTFDEMDMAMLPHATPNSTNDPALLIAHPPRNTSLAYRGTVANRQQHRRSSHNPVFREHLGETPETTKRISSIHAENLENKEFLQRASKHSSATTYSQESAVLPPFARRSQMLDANQAAFFQDDDSRRSSDPPSEKEREQRLGSNGEVSPVTARSSAMHAGISPISPSSPGNSTGPFSPDGTAVGDSSVVRPGSQLSVSSSNDSQKRASEVTARQYSVILAPPQIETIAEGSVESSPIELNQRHFSGQEPQVLARGMSIHHIRGRESDVSLQNFSSAPSGSHLELSVPEGNEKNSTSDNTSQVTQDVAISKLVEKRKSAVGHSRKSSNLPKHHPSNASRFSFQFGGGESAAEEQALEEKHRKIASRDITETVVRGSTPEDDEDDYFDEDAMDDMDEFEMQTPADEPPGIHLHPQLGDNNMQNPGTSQPSLYLQQAREALRLPESDDGSIYDDIIPDVTDEREIPYADHPAFRAHSALASNSRHNSMLPDPGEGYWRDSTIDHYMRDSYMPPHGHHTRSNSGGSRMGMEGHSPTLPSASSGQDFLSAADALPGTRRFQKPRSNSDVHSAASSPAQSPLSENPPVPARDSGNSERNRAVSGMAFGTSVESPRVENRHSRDVGASNVSAFNVPSGLDQSLSNDGSQPPNEGGRPQMEVQTLHSSTDIATTAEKPVMPSSTDDGMITTGDAKLRSPMTSPRVSKVAQLSEKPHEEPSDRGNIASASRRGPVSSAEDRRTNSEAIASQESASSPQLASEEDMEKAYQSRIRYRDARRHGSVASFSMMSPTRSTFSQQSRESGMSFEDFVKSGFSRVQSPNTSGNEDAATFGVMTPPLDKEENEPQRLVSSSSKASSSRAASTGLGLNVFSGFDFEDRLSAVPQEVNTSDASDSDNELIASQSDQVYTHDSPNTASSGKARSSDLPGYKSSITSGSENDRAGSGTPVSSSSPRTKSSAIGMSWFDFDENRASVQSITRKPVQQSTSNTGEAPEKTRLANLGHPALERQAAPRTSRHALQQAAFSTPPGAKTHSERTSASTSSKADPAAQNTAKQGDADKHLAVRTSLKPKQHTRSSSVYDDGQDDMYFDDGNFDQDIQEPHTASIDENAFDDDNFLYRPNAAVNGFGHRRDRSSGLLSHASLGSDGPYPSFVNPNAAKARARESQLLLEDLPLQSPVDPKLIPQRNPSEDARRLGLSDRAPPVPVAPSNTEAYINMQSNLEKYHAALAEAANKAAADGRFLRMPSTSTQRSASTASKADDARSQLTADDKSYYSHDEDDEDVGLPHSNGGGNLVAGRSNIAVSHLSHLTSYSPQKMSFDGTQRMSFDFGFDEAGLQDFDDDYGNDDDLVAAANAEALANDDEGFYGQEFQFFGRPRANSGDMEAVNGGWFGEHGDDGLQRNKSLREPNLTPITERSEFSTRNSFIGLGAAGQLVPPSAGGYAPHSPALARMPITPLMEDDITSFDDLRRLRAQAFGASNASVKSNSNRSSQQSLHNYLSPTLDTNAGAAMSHGYFGPMGAPTQVAYSSGTNGSGGNPPGGHPLVSHGFNFQESPQSAASSNGNPFAMDLDATPKRNTAHSSDPPTARKMPPAPRMSPVSPHSSGGVGGRAHSRQGSGADSVTYVREPDPEGNGKPRWVLERRRTSEQGQLELIGREPVQGGWI